MSVINTMTISQMVDDLRSDEYAKWSYAASHAIAEYLDEMSEDLGESIEWDRVAIRCEFTEYTFEELTIQFSDEMDIDYREEFWNLKSGLDFDHEPHLDNLRDHVGAIIEVDNGEEETTYIIQE